MINLASKLEIERLGQRGEGIARGAKGPIYVPYALPGETILAEVDGERGHLVEVLKPSAQRIAACCRAFSICGGCAVQTLAREAYAQWKLDCVKAPLKHAGLDLKVEPFIAAHGEGRRRATLHVRFDAAGQPQAGFMQARAHHIVEISSCPLLAPPLSQALSIGHALALKLREAPKPLDILVTSTLNGLDIDLKGYGPLQARQRQALIETAINYDLVRLSNHADILVELKPPVLDIGKAQVKLPPGVFLQATEAGERELANRVMSLTTGTGYIADLFAGIGTFSLRLAENAQVQAYDIEHPALAALRAASHAPNLKPVEIVVRNLFETPLSSEELTKFDCVVFDPPRAGAQAQARSLAQSKVPLVIAISCSAQTFARDASILRQGGYEIETAAVIDQFLYSPHVEIIAPFRRPEVKAKRARRLLG